MGKGDVDPHCTFWITIPDRPSKRKDLWSGLVHKLQHASNHHPQQPETQRRSMLQPYVHSCSNDRCDSSADTALLVMTGHQRGL